MAAVQSLPAPAVMSLKAALHVIFSSMYGLGRVVDRNITFVELFAGEANWSCGMRSLSYEGVSIDARRNYAHDFLTPAGFMATLSAVLRIRPGGVFWAGPPCSTWVFMSRHSTGRDKDVRGNWESSPYVASQNALVSRLLVILRLCMARGVYYIIEQPRSSIMFEYPPFAKFLQKHPARTCHTEMGAFGMKAEKDTILKGTAPYISELERRLNSQERKRLRLDASKTKTSVEGENCLGGKTRRGTPDLKATQAYPLEFGCAHALKFQAHDLAKADDEHVPVAKRRRVDSRSASADMVHGFLRSRLPDASERTLLDDLSDMSDEEDPWFLDDLKTGNPGRWHNNATSENTLSLPGSSA